MKWVLLLIIGFPLSLAFANDRVLNVYNWSNFMPHQVIQAFEKETGIRVHYAEFDGNDTLYTKLKADPHSDFDVIVPSSYYVDRMRRESMLRPIDKNYLPNLKYINPLLLNRSFDPHNQYSIPYLWGTTGIVVNDQYFNPRQLRTWRDLWNKRYKNQLLMLDDAREVFAIALLSLGYSINDRNPQHITQAYHQLRALMPNIKLFNADAEGSIYIDEDVNVGIGWSGDIYVARQENKHLHYLYPKPTFPIWIDCLAIPKYAPHYQNAMIFLNFLMRPTIAKQITLAKGYSSPNWAAIRLLPKNLQRDLLLNPSNELLKRGEVEADLGPSDAVYEKYWELLKL
ncbi:MAG: spermidine/putrescine ABC transporter substrate-binding protein [Coxiella sp. RIFCSPHIGHO2_12_FULL_44_14]|nr:MAG: spermidine/putrescine ABC transporter substrate-binding protein [Coxiella sp. RIFCSPHIGHO2_12_FULL_44_14]